MNRTQKGLQPIQFFVFRLWFLGLISGRQHFLPDLTHGKSKSLMFTQNPCKAGPKEPSGFSNRPLEIFVRKQTQRNQLYKVMREKRNGLQQFWLRNQGFRICA
jgi:hypothetical protein